MNPDTTRANSDLLPGTAELIIRNGQITTLDPGRPSATTLAVSNGVITAVGDENEIMPLAGPGTRVVDALNRRVVPGLIDSHLHIVRGGNHFGLELRWDGVSSLADGLRMIKEQAQRTPPGQWVRVIGGWTAAQFAENRMPTLAELNAAAPDTPVMVLHLYQSALLNKAALKAAGIGAETPDPAGAQIVRDHSGQPSGMLLATPQAGILYGTLAKAPSLDAEQRLNSTRRFQAELNRFGLTGAIDAAGGFQAYPDDYDAVRELARRGELTVRIAYNLMPQRPGHEVEDMTQWTTMATPGDGDSWLRLNGAGEILIWAGNDLEIFTEPLVTPPAEVDAELERALRVLLGSGWGFRLHSTYDQTMRRYLDVIEKVAADGLLEGNRWFFDHGETATPETIERIARLGGGIAIQDRMAFQGEAFMDRYGAGRATTAPPIVDMLAAGLPVGAGTDATRVSSYNPWVSLSWLVTGRTVGGVRYRTPNQLLARETALRLYTEGSAWFSGEQEDKGRISVGRLADFAILDRDYFAVPDREIAHIESVLTVVGGRVVHAVGIYEGIAAPLPPHNPAWSPDAHFHGYQRRPVPAGASLADAWADLAGQVRRPAQGTPTTETLDSCVL